MIINLAPSGPGDRYQSTAAAAAGEKISLPTRTWTRDDGRRSVVHIGGVRRSSNQRWCRTTAVHGASPTDTGGLMDRRAPGQNGSRRTPVTDAASPPCPLPQTRRSPLPIRSLVSRPSRAPKPLTRVRRAARRREARASPVRRGGESTGRRRGMLQRVSVALIKPIIAKLTILIVRRTVT